MIEIDGSQGEGGGQILRTTLALALITQTPVRLKNIRARRNKPGLRAQHVTCVEAAAAVGDTRVDGLEVGTRELTFEPKTIQPGEYLFDIGTAGSTSLVLQTILPALIRAPQPSRVDLRGGTHNAMAPPFEFLTRAYFPLLARMGPQVEGRLDRAGFFPKGGGKVSYRITPTRKLTPLELLERGETRAVSAEALLSRLSDHVGERELATIQAALDWPEDVCHLRKLKKIKGPGNAVVLTVESEHVTEVVTAFGEKGVPAERVAGNAVSELSTYLGSAAPVGEHLADQLLLLLALAGGGRFRTLPLSGHTKTQILVIPKFLPVRIETRPLTANVVEVEVSRA